MEDEFVVIGLLQGVDQLVVVLHVAVEGVARLVVVAEEAKTVLPCAKVGIVAVVDNLGKHIVRHFCRTYRKSADADVERIT